MRHKILIVIYSFIFFFLAFFHPVSSFANICGGAMTATSEVDRCGKDFLNGVYCIYGRTSDNFGGCGFSNLGPPATCSSVGQCAYLTNCGYFCTVTGGTPDGIGGYINGNCQVADANNGGVGGIACFSSQGCTCYTPNCDQGVVCGGCYWNGVGNTCSGNGNQDCFYTTYSRGGACNQTYAWTNYGVCSVYACNATYTCPAGVCVTNIQGTAYLDYNHNNNQDAGEPNINPATIQMTGTRSGTQTVNGSYNFTNLPMGTYTIRLTNPPANTLPVTPLSVTTSLTATSGRKTIDFPVTPIYTISGQVFVDYDHNRVLDGSDTPYTASSLTVTINPATGTGQTTTTTVQADGSYTFQNVESGTYTLSIQNVPAGYLLVAPISVTVNQTTGNKTGQNIGITPVYSISGQVFVDYNHNGTLDAEDTAYTASTLTVTINPATGTGQTTTTTQANGSYSFQNVESGTYTITLATVPPAYKLVAPLQVTVDQTTGNITNANLPITPLYFISGTIYNDFNEDGLYNGADTPYTATPLQVTFFAPGTPPFSLVIPANTPRLGNFTTGAVLVAGQYTVTITLPTGYHMTWPPPSSYSLTVGTPGKSIPCLAPNVHDMGAGCDAKGDITGANFGMTNQNAWGAGGPGGTGGSSFGTGGTGGTGAGGVGGGGTTGGTGGGQDGTPCVYDIDCDQGLACNAGGSGCICSASLRPGTCNVGNGGATKGGGQQGSGGSCVYDVDCANGLACDGNGTICTCQASPGRPGTCSICAAPGP
jgi:hypothetical protein